ncbi:MAG: RagB/SusD family nutrient uptake outer membrane protein [Bacteroidales bacterium]|nr:RagB/SusD family nutrient uptake outer membrane protein [Bacteroidales bacterium]
MRTIYKIPAVWIVAVVFFLFSQSCEEYLEESPRTVFTTAYFETPQGIQDAVNAAYAYQRYIYAPNGALALFHEGTDEWTFGEQPYNNSSGDNLQHKECGSYTLTSGNGAISQIWNNSYPAINLCNGIIELAPNASGLTEQQLNTILGEAHFLRALFYFNLVTQYGAAPLDLGSGDLRLNTTPFFGFNRLPTDELLVKNYQAMIDDLTFAGEHLPTMKEPDNYKLTQAAALHMLAKVYIFRHYTLAAQAGDVDSAYVAAMQLINNLGTYGVELLQNFADVFKQGNDYNTEILYAVERISGNNVNNMYLDPTGIGGYECQANNNFTPNYQQAIGGLSLIDGRPLPYQRPLRKIAPTKWLTMTCFADKVNDSRYHGTFRTLYRTASVNEPGTQAYDDFVILLQENGFEIGDTAWYMPDTQEEADAINALNVRYRVLGPDDWYTNQNRDFMMHPALIKFIDSLRVTFNDASGRPYPVCRLAETYLLAAEAAMILGRNAEAADLINVLKRRAAYKPGLNQAAVDARYANIAVTEADINLDFILDERSREMAGEWVRWSDLAVRGKLYERALAHNPDVTGLIGESTGKYNLRPIPQAQIDAINDPEREKFQNPGYSTVTK